MKYDHLKVKIGVAQATPALFDIDRTVTIICNWINQAAEQNCKLLLFPECFIPCYPRGLTFDAVVGHRSELSREIWMDYWSNSFVLGSDHFHAISNAVKNAGIMVALSVTEQANDGGTLYCSLLYFDEFGTLVGKHRKLKPTGLERYLWGEGNGETLTTINTSIGKVGGLICWENYMPLARMSMYNKGVEIYLAPTADSRPAWQSTVQHIALEGRCFVAACNQFIRKSDYPERYQSLLLNEPEIMCPGGSVIISPMGEQLAGPVYNEEMLLTAELDHSLLIKSKLDFDVIGHYARPDVFQLHVHKQPDTIDTVRDKRH